MARRFGSSRVFHDVRSIRPGEPFRTAIERTLRGCDAALVIIGPQWTTCTNEDGTRRLHAPDDLVRAEVATALRSGALVVPVLVRGAEPPQAADLPADLTGLSGIQAVRLDASRSLEDELSGTLQAIAAAPVRRTPLMLVGAHLSAASFPFVFYQGDGLLVEEFTTTLAIVLPPLAACLAVAAAAWARNVSPARVRHVRAAELFVPMIFVAAIAALVLAKAFNIGIGSFESFKRLLVATEVAFSAYTGLALASMFENRSES